MNSILRITDPILKDDSIDKYEDIAYEPITGTNINSPGQDIRITIETQDIFTHPSESYLIVEGRLLKRGVNPPNDPSYDDGDLITLTNNGIMHLFKRIRYELSGQEIENIVNVGQSTTMLGMLKYPDDFSKSKGLNQLWYKDTSMNALNTNTGFDIRRKYIIRDSDPPGTFSFKIPLKHIFGFCEDYNKVVYGLKHTLTLTRNNDNDAIFKSNARVGNPAVDRVVDGEVNPSDYELLYPLFLFDVSKQSEKLKYSTTDIQVKMSFDDPAPPNTQVYGVIISDRLINFQSDGNKFSVVF